MKVSELLPSTYLKKEDFPAPQLLTIARLERVNVAMDGQPPEYKWALHFTELDRALVLNTVNIQTLAALYGDETDHWIGQKIVAYNDPSVMFAGRMVGGIRLRAPKQPQARPAPAKPAPAGQFDDLDEDTPY